MKKIILLAIFLITANLAIAQQQPFIVLQKVKDTLPCITSPSIDNMPNALAGKKYPEKLIRNNGQGFNIYENGLDNMPVLKPDSSFKSNMASSVPLKNNRKFNLANFHRSNEMIKPYDPLKPKKKTSPLFNIPKTDLQAVPLVP